MLGTLTEYLYNLGMSKAISSQAKSTFRVYKITNAVNGKTYIGISSRPVEQRFKEHLSRAACTQRFSRLYAAMRKYGAENFSVEELEEAGDEDQVRYLECKYIAQFNSYRKGYNCNLGGNGFLVFPEHIKRKISESQIGKKIDPEVVRKMAEARKGDRRWHGNLGEYRQKGGKSPLAKRYEIQFPDGSCKVIRGLRGFCRDHKINYPHLANRGRTKGYVLLRRFND